MLADIFGELLIAFHRTVVNFIDVISISGLQNDHTALLKRIEEGLSVVLSPSGQANSDPNGTNTPAPPASLEPFARVSSVEHGSPAYLAVS